MSSVLGAFDLYYFCFCAAVGGIASGITVAKDHRWRAARVGTAVGAGLYIIQLPVWLAVVSPLAAYPS